MVNIVIFGIGNMYETRRNFFEEHKDRIRITAFLDNNTEVQGKEKDGIFVYPPECVKELHFDRIVILSTKFMREMTEQLLTLGIEQSLIWDLHTLKLSALRGKRTCYGGKKKVHYSRNEKY